MIRIQWLLALIVACAAVPGCGKGGDARPAGERDTERKNPIAKKPLKLFSDKQSQEWKNSEAKLEAEKRAMAYKDKNSVYVTPNKPDPLRSKPFGLKDALAGLTGKGPLKAVIETSVGNITCELLEKEQPLAVAHFVGLARGTRPWWDPAQGLWSDQPFYKANPVYQVRPGEAFFAGCPMGLGFAEVGFRTIVGVPGSDLLDKPYILSMPLAKRTPSIGPQFLITAKPDVVSETAILPIGRCGNEDVITKLVSLELTPTGRPVENVVVRNITITR
ncbi:MAG: peptidylprolyl isomerase [Deltaproteobacteria bacterium]|nr:peptidylprolyl isomerase [Deltaproteobacteria bacterium]